MGRKWGRAGGRPWSHAAAMPPDARAVVLASPGPLSLAGWGPRAERENDLVSDRPGVFR